MKLVGMLDSPYVRRVAISLQVLGLPFEHQSLSVFRSFDEFRRINPVVKAPTLVCDDGEVLMDSTLILQYAEALARPRSLVPSDLPVLQHDLHVLGLALAGCEKAVQFIYERALRPEEKRHAPWIARVTGQMHEAFAALDATLASRPLSTNLDALTQGGVTAAVTWTFLRETVPELADPATHRALARFTDALEALPAFRNAPHGDGTVAGTGH